MKINDLKPAPGSKKSRRRVGRGLGSGRGKTAGRGQKGQSSRSGFSQGAGWEGGRSRLVMRLPKRGFTREREEFQLVNLEDLSVFEEGATVTAETLEQRGLVRYANKPVKLLGRGELEVSKLQVDVDAFSRSAAQAVIASGGTVRGADELGAGEAAPKKGKQAKAQSADEKPGSARKQNSGSAAAEGEAGSNSAAKASGADGTKASGAKKESKAKAAKKPAEEETQGASEDGSGEEQQ
ncbi:MAG TPA: 50S ribosomal protein L15 [Trueperaceae bacterium]